MNQALLTQCSPAEVSQKFKLHRVDDFNVYGNKSIFYAVIFSLFMLKYSMYGNGSCLEGANLKQIGSRCKFNHLNSIS